jgi:hypothetical protein
MVADLLALQKLRMELVMRKAERMELVKKLVSALQSGKVLA